MPLSGFMYDAKGHRIAGASAGCLIFAASWLALTLGGDLDLPAWTPVGTTVGTALGAA
jgi:hypothetical protein